MNQENTRQIIILVVVMVLLAGALYYSFSSVSGGVANTAIGGGGAGGGGVGGSNIATFESVFDDVDVDIDQLIQNIQNVEFVYEEVRIARNPAQPILSGNEVDPNEWPPAPLNPDGDSLVFLAEQKKVTGIIWDDASPLAVIDGEVVGVGHEFVVTADNQAIVVKRIGEDFVILAIPSEDEEITKSLVEVEEG